MRLLVSACLGGRTCRYDGKSRSVTLIQELIDCGVALPICPEVDGGLTVPRSASEIVGGTGVDVLQEQARVINKDGEDVSTEFRKGAEESLRIARENGAIAAILCERSPSCGVRMIYDGTFCRQLQPGMGVTSAILARDGIELISSEDPDLRGRIKDYLELMRRGQECGLEGGSSTSGQWGGPSASGLRR